MISAHPKFANVNPENRKMLRIKLRKTKSEVPGENTENRQLKTKNATILGEIEGNTESRQLKTRTANILGGIDRHHIQNRIKQIKKSRVFLQRGTVEKKVMRTKNLQNPSRCLRRRGKGQNQDLQIEENPNLVL